MPRACSRETMAAVRVRGILLVLVLAAIGCSFAPNAAAIRPDERGPVVAHVRQRGATIVGGLGVLGPTRMDYPGNIATVRAVARYVGELLAQN